MFQNFRLSMAWLHTWFGLVLGFVLMVVFFFGSLSVFDREIDRHHAIFAERAEKARARRQMAEPDRVGRLCEDDGGAGDQAGGRAGTETHQRLPARESGRLQQV